MLKGNKIFLRTIDSTDVDLIFKWENNPQNWEVSNTVVPFTRKQIEDYVNSIQDIYIAKQLRFIICEAETNRPLGAIDFFDFDGINLKAGIGILIEEITDRKKGYAFEAIELIKEYAFSVLGLHQLYCNVLVDNLSSVKLFEKAGFSVSGTKKDWVKTKEGWKDELLLQLFNL